MAPEPFRAAASRVSCALALLACLALPAHALRFVNWNILNYPGTTGATRDPFYRTVLQPLSPDFLAAEEMVSTAGVTEFLNNLNTMEPGQWSTIPSFDGGDTFSQLYYKPSKVQFLGQWVFYPNPANLLRFVHVWRLKPVGYASDAAEFRVYSLHLKASMGFEAQRLAECTGLRDSMNAMPPGTHALVCGDFNFYTGLEPGMQKLVELQGNNIGRVYDPLGLENVAWQDNTSMQSAWTQSTCKTGDTGCASGAATGGLDDRFDLILPTLPWQDGQGLELVPGSYVAVGNDGQHHNNSIQDLPTIPEGAAYATALHSVSDHLPERVDLRLPALMGPFLSLPLALGTVITGAAGVGASVFVSNDATTPGETLSYTFSAPAGVLAPAGTRTAAPGVVNEETIALDTSVPGAYSGTLQVTSNSADQPTRGRNVSGTVLAHAVASLDSLVAVSAGSRDLGTHVTGAFTPAEVRVHNVGGGDALKAGLRVASTIITGGEGHFSVSGTVPQILHGTGATFNVAFDDVNTTADSTYTATLTIGSADEPLPGAQAATPLAVTLSARRQADATTDAGTSRPTATMLFAPAPNPLAGESVLRFDLAQAGEARLDAFDAAGRRVARLVHSSLEPGRYSIRWDGRGEHGEALGAGLYFVRLSAPGMSPRTVRLAIVR